MRETSLLLYVSMFFLTPLTASYGAVVQNASFENGLTGWTVVGGDATTAGTAFGVAPTNLANQASLNNVGIGAATDSAIEAALNLAAGRLDVLAGGAPPQAVSGTAIFQIITGVVAGDVLTFDWTFLTNENFAQGFPNQNDFAFWSISDTATPGTILYRAADPLTPTGQPGFTFKSPTLTVTHSFTTPGDYLLSFGVVNVIDGGGASNLLIDNVRVPEPSSFAALAGISVVVFTLRRRRNR